MHRDILKQEYSASTNGRNIFIERCINWLCDELIDLMMHWFCIDWLIDALIDALCDLYVGALNCYLNSAYAMQPHMATTYVYISFIVVCRTPPCHPHITMQQCPVLTTISIITQSALYHQTQPERALEDYPPSGLPTRATRKEKQNGREHHNATNTCGHLRDDMQEPTCGHVIKHLAQAIIGALLNQTNMEGVVPPYPKGNGVEDVVVCSDWRYEIVNFQGVNVGVIFIYTPKPGNKQRYCKVKVYTKKDRRTRWYSLHGVIAFITRGYNMPPSNIVHHTCGKRTCVAPTHLVWSTCLENSSDQHDKRSAKASAQPRGVNGRFIKVDGGETGAAAGAGGEHAGGDAGDDAGDGARTVGAGSRVGPNHHGGVDQQFDSYLSQLVQHAIPFQAAYKEWMLNHWAHHMWVHFHVFQITTQIATMHLTLIFNAGLLVNHIPQQLHKKWDSNNVDSGAPKLAPLWFTML